jgi:Ca2+-transporting ATPase
VSRWHAIPPDDALAELGSRRDGLTAPEARERLARVGPNALPSPRAYPWWRVLGAQLRSTVVLLLIAAAILALAFGDVVDAVAIAAVLVLNVAIGFGTELPARRAIEALHALEAPRAVALRDGHAAEIDARDLVPGDVIVLEPGAAVPADGRLLDATELRNVEATLTGESEAARKDAAATVPDDAPLAERPTIVYSGTTVADGHAHAVVFATGQATELGRIGQLVGAITPVRTPLERRLDVLGGRLAVVALAVAAVVAGLSALQGAALPEVIQLAIALAVAAVPEGLPAVATITLALGVRRMARRRALVRRLPVVETLGSATVVCTDKTGTLTTGEMTATRVWAPGAAHPDVQVTGAGYAPDGQFRAGDGRVDPRADPALSAVLTTAALATRADLREPSRPTATWVATGDPTDVAMLTLLRKAGIDRAQLVAAEPEAGLLPFSSARALMASYHRAADGALVAQVKGGPAAVLARCTMVQTPDGVRPLDGARREEIDARNQDFATRGLRVLAVARGPVAAPEEPALTGLAFLGLVGLSDPPAPDVEDTVQAFRQAGLRTVLVTGDQHRTALALGRRIGLLDAAAVAVEGRELDRLTDPELQESAARASVVSRVSPEGKLRLVRALQGAGEIVAMLGDGVNDAAALRQANIGVAMGRRGTDVAKQAADVVLQDDRFATIGAAIEEGRVIADNIRKFVFYLFSCNLAEVLVFLGAAVAGWAAPLLPLQILWLNLVTDTFPALALALEPGEPDVMRRPPEDPRAPILNASATRAVVGYAILIAGVTLAAMAWGLSGHDGGAARATTLAFLTLGVSQVFHLGNARSADPVATRARVVSNRYAVAGALLALGLQALAVHWPPLATLLGAATPGLTDWVVVLGLSLVPAVVGQLLKGAVVKRR